MDEQKPELGKPAKDKQKIVGILMLEAGIEFAFLIAVPLIAGLLLGKWLDRKYNQHFFVIVGILLGITITCIAVYQRIKDYKKMLK
jgi:F0F1-type ATP synthase assembly protein I